MHFCFKLIFVQFECAEPVCVNLALNIGLGLYDVQIGKSWFFNFAKDINSQINARFLIGSEGLEWYWHC